MAEKTTNIYDSTITDRRELQNLVTEKKKLLLLLLWIHAKQHEAETRFPNGSL